MADTTSSDSTLHKSQSTSTVVRSGHDPAARGLLKPVVVDTVGTSRSSRMAVWLSEHYTGEPEEYVQHAGVPGP